MANKEEFLSYCGISACSSSLLKISSKFEIFSKFFNGNLDNLDLNKCRSFLSWLNSQNYASSTSNDIIKIFKRFLRWKYKNWSFLFDNFKDFKLKKNPNRVLSKNDLLTPDEMKFLVNSIESLKYKTLLMIFQETACRPQEVFDLLWKDINFDKKEIKLFSSKTGMTRFIPINKSIEHLKRYKTECFYNIPLGSEKVFNTTNGAFNLYLHKLEKKLGFSKHLYSYLWRHSVLTQMIKKLSPKAYEMFSGHALETGLKIYAHLDTEDLETELYDKVYNISKMDSSEISDLRSELKSLNYKLSEIEKFIGLYP